MAPRAQVSWRGESLHFHLNRMEGREGTGGFRSICGTGGIRGCPDDAPKSRLGQ